VKRAHARLLLAGVAATSLAVWAGAATNDARLAMAQTVDTRSARTLVVGTPVGGSRVDRVNAGRTGQAHDPLPASEIRAEWQTPFLGVALEHAPLVDSAGTTYVVGAQGDVIAVGRDGTEAWRATSGATQPGPPALLSDGSVVLVGGAGDAVAVRQGRVRWRTRFGRPEGVRPAPLPLDDGGAVVATARDLAALDADGSERARATLPEPAATPLIAAMGGVVVVSSSGTVYLWSPGGEPTRAGSFGSPPDQGAALLDDHTLVAVTAGHTHLSSVDLARGTTETRAIASSGLWLGPPSTSRGGVTVLMLTQTAELLVTLDGRNTEVSRARLAARQPILGQDGGPIALVPPPHVPPLTDASGTVAFATSEGAGVVSGGAVESLADICPSASGGSVTGLAPLGPGAFVVACRAGSLVAVHGTSRR
jgi:hypothetical protein